jgi:oxaloacetate decarboxylase alpha subunit
VEEFVKLSVENGIDIIRIFDALNDFDNIRVAMAATKKAGAHAQGSISYTTSPVHTTEKFVEMAKELRDMGADSICIKDMSGILLPYEGAKLVKAIKAEVDLPVELHSHMTSGVADLMYLKGIEAGADIIDTALSPLAMGSSQPATESFVMTLKDTPYDTGLNVDVLMDLAKYFRLKRDEYLDSGLLNPKVMGVDIRTLWYQVPGGMLSNLVSQLSESNKLHQLDDVMAEVPKVREDLGYPPLVTPTSQIVGTQALFNVLTGERYKMVPEEVKAYMRGEYGKSPTPVNEELKEKILKGQTPKVETVKTLAEFKKEIGEYYTQPEDVLSYALFPQVALEFFKKREARLLELDNDLLDRENKVYPV